MIHVACILLIAKIPTMHMDDGLMAPNLATAEVARAC